MGHAFIHLPYPLPPDYVPSFKYMSSFMVNCTNVDFASARLRPCFPALGRCLCPKRHPLVEYFTASVAWQRGDKRKLN